MKQIIPCWSVVSEFSFEKKKVFSDKGIVNDFPPVRHFVKIRCKEHRDVVEMGPENCCTIPRTTPCILTIKVCFLFLGKAVKSLLLWLVHRIKL